MGEISDSLINGEFDFHTGEYIGRPVGYPRTLDGSLPWEKRRPQQPTNGVMNYLMKKGVRQHQVEEILRKYAEHKVWDISGKKFIRKCSAKIQLDWNGFCNWYAKYKNTQQVK
jgi:hypothetical protein